MSEDNIKRINKMVTEERNRWKSKKYRLKKRIERIRRLLKEVESVFLDIERDL